MRQCLKPSNIDLNLDWVAFEAYAKLATNDDLPKIECMLSDANYDVRIAAATSYAKIASHEEIQMFLRRTPGVRMDVQSRLDQLVYAPDCLRPLFEPNEEED